jgi:hypothetical protein
MLHTYMCVCVCVCARARAHLCVCVCVSRQFARTLLTLLDISSSHHDHHHHVQVYENSCKFLLRGVLEGYNATVFAYGPTGAGKTFTMTGSEAHPGVMTRSISDLFRLMAEDATDVNYSVAVNYVEIYNECIRDLLVRVLARPRLSVASLSLSLSLPLSLSLSLPVCDAFFLIGN